MITIALSLIFAYWCKKAIPLFAEKTNKQIYQEFADFVQPVYSLSEFKQKSSLQAQQSKLSWLFFILFPLTLLINHPLLAVILMMLIYLSLLDILYYLTDINAIALIFLLSIAYLLFPLQPYLEEAIFSLFFTALLFIFIHWFSEKVLHKTGLGLGDSLLFVSLSPLFHADEMLILILLASLLGIVVFLLIKLIKKRKLIKLPFIPFISLSTLILLFAKMFAP